MSILYWVYFLLWLVGTVTIIIAAIAWIKREIKTEIEENRNKKAHIKDSVDELIFMMTYTESLDEKVLSYLMKTYNKFKEAKKAGSILAQKKFLIRVIDDSALAGQMEIYKYDAEKLFK